MLTVFPKASAARFATLTEHAFRRSRLSNWPKEGKEFQANHVFVIATSGTKRHEAGPKPFVSRGLQIG
jgi:hypothetical protein